MKIKEKIHYAVKTQDYLRVFFLRFIGNFLILSSLFLIGKTFATPLYEEALYFYHNQIDKKYVVIEDSNQTAPQNPFLPEVPKGGLAKLLNLKPQIEALHPVNTNYSILIPKIGANAGVIPNVDASNENDYLDKLQKGVAHAKGTAFPGEGGHIFLFAHSTDYIWNANTYNAVFYLLYKLDSGDEINLFYQGQRYLYRVEGKQIVDPTQVEFLTRKTDSEFLTLQTCWPPGTSLQRLLVFARRVAE